MSSFTADQYIGGNFTWFTGVVEDRIDPEKMGRVRVRCFGFHSASKGLIPTEDLPWATVMMPTTSAAVSGIGMSPHGLVEGSWVVGFFRDGPSAQDPIIMGSILGYPTQKNPSSQGFTDPNGVFPKYANEPDVNKLARGDNTITYTPDVSIGEPNTAYAAEYPMNKVIETESGHKIELDDTPGAERIRVMHKSGSFTEMHPNGDVVHRQLNKYDVTLSNDNCHVQGNVNLIVDSNVNWYVRGNLDVFSSGDMSFKCGGNVSFDAAGGYKESATTINMNSDPANPFAPEAQKLILALAGSNAAFDDDFDETVVEEKVISEDVPQPKTVTTDTTPEVANKPDLPITCQDIPDDISGDDLDKFQLSSNYTVADLSSKALFKHRVVAQHGFTVAQMVCNMKALSENVLEKVNAQYPGFRINSGFRTSTGGTSQHERGMAVDIQWPGISNKEYLARAQWIKANVTFDQLIFEHGNSIWLHLSYDRNRVIQKTPQRGKSLTYYPKDSPKYKPGITLYYA